jgi:hypothetical protein
MPPHAIHDAFASNAGRARGCGERARMPATQLASAPGAMRSASCVVSREARRDKRLHADRRRSLSSSVCAHRRPRRATKLFFIADTRNGGAYIGQIVQNGLCAFKDVKATRHLPLSE